MDGMHHVVQGANVLVKCKTGFLNKLLLLLWGNKHGGLT